MVVVGITMVKDEIDIIQRTIEHMLGQVDRIIVFDDGSTDGTFGTLANYEGPQLRLVNAKRIKDHYTSYQPLMRDGYYQSEKITCLAHMAREGMNASWVVPFDADEIWVSQWGTIKEVCENHENTYAIIRAELFDHVASGIDGDDPDPIERIQYRRVHSLPLPKVACRATSDLVIEQGNHGARYHLPARFTEECPIIVHHYPYRSVEQFIGKVRNGAAAYAKTNLPDSVGAHWRQWGRFNDEALERLFHKWYYRENPCLPLEVDGELQRRLIKDKPI